MATLYRYLDLDRAKVDKEKRTIPFALSSEFPFDRYERGGVHYREILDHSPGSVDMTRMRKGTGFFWHHDVNKPIGVIESVTVDNDRVMRGVVRFGKSAFAEEKFQDVLDDISTQVSIGYDHVKPLARSKDPKDNVEIIRFAWAPHEASLEPIAVDPTVGKGRSLDPTDENNPNHHNRMTTPAIETAPDRVTLMKDLRAEETKRVKEIQTAAAVLVKQYPQGAEKVRSLVDTAIAEGTLSSDFNSTLLGAIEGVAKVTRTTADIGMSEGDKKKYSLLRAIQCICEGRQVDGFEKEVSDTARAKGQKDGCSYSGNFAVPTDITVDVGRAAIGSMIHRSLSHQHQRDLNVTTASQGGNFVATQLITPIIEILRNRVVLNRLGIQTMSGLSGNIAIPRQTGAATAYSVSESAQLTISTQAINQVSMSPKRVGAYNQYTKQLLLQSSVDVENFIRDDLMKVVAIKLDYLGLQGSGAASQPTGVLNTSGVGTITFGAAATFAKMVSMETALATANADAGRMAYITTPAARGVLKSAAKLLVGATTVTAVPIWDGSTGDGSTDGIVNGFRAAASNQVDNNLAFFGNWEELILGMWGGFDVVVNPYSLDREAEVRITVNTFIDYAVRHAVSFCVSTDNANQ